MIRYNKHELLISKRQEAASDRAFFLFFIKDSEKFRDKCQIMNVFISCALNVRVFNKSFDKFALEMMYL